MPKSKRDKKVSLTQAKKKGLALKQKLIEDIRDCADKYARIFTFSVKNMRSVCMKDIRTNPEWRDSRFFFGKNKVMQLALGRTAEDEHHHNLHLLSKHMQGETGLLFTNKEKDTVQKFFKAHKVPDFARPGNKATETVILKEGPLPSISFVSEDQLRKLGLPLELKRGVIHLLHDLAVCKKGETLNPQQARLVKLLGHKMADFHVILTSMWTKNKGWQKLVKSADKQANSKDKHKAGKGRKKQSSKSKEESMELDAEVSEEEKSANDVEEGGDDEDNDDNDGS